VVPCGPGSTERALNAQFSTLGRYLLEKLALAASSVAITASTASASGYFHLTVQPTGGVSVSSGSRPSSRASSASRRYCCVTAVLSRESSIAPW
jgi:hypothetical protein